MALDHGLLLAIALWYLCACVAVTTSKQILATIHLPAFLCLIQNGIGCICCRLVTAATSSSFEPIAPAFRPLVLKIGVVYAIGFWLTNTSISMMSASLAETIKSFEPITSVALAAMFLQEAAPTGTKLVGVLMAVCGVILATHSESTANAAGVSTAALSTICFSLRGMYSRQLKEVTTIGVVTAETGENQIQKEDSRERCCRPSKDATAAATEQVLGLQEEGEHAHTGMKTTGPVHEGSGPNSNNLFYRVCQISTIISLVFMLATEDIALVSGHMQASWVHEWAHAVGLWKLIALNGLTYWAYNQMPFVVLGRVTLVTHAVFNVCRRLVIVVVSTLWFATGFGSTTAMGLVIAFLGFMLFAEPWVSQSKSHKSIAGEEQSEKDSKDELV